MTSRKELQTKLLREAEEARLTRPLEEARRREERVQRPSRARKSAAAPKRTVSAEEAAAEEPAAAEEDAQAAAEAPAQPEAPAPARDEDEERNFRRPAATPQRPSVPSRLARAAAATTQRQRGKLTVSRALPTRMRAAPVRWPRFAAPARRKSATTWRPGPSAKQVRDVDVPEAITVQELAKRMGERGADLVKALFKMGTPVTITETIDQDTAELLISEFGHRIKRVSEADVDIDTQHRRR